MFVVGNVDLLGGSILELKEVQRGKVAGRIIQEHVFRAWVGCADGTCGWRGVPVVHGGVEVQTRIGRGPGGMRDLFPQVASLQRLHHSAVATSGEVPVAVAFDSAQEIVLQ